MKIHFSKIIFLILLCCIALPGCGSSDKYYDNTPLKKFETFTSVTGIELSGTQETERNAGTIYIYIFNNDADGMSAMLKYETYIKEYGFVEGDSDGNGMTFYEKDNKYRILISMSQPQETVIQYMVIVPHMTIEETDALSEKVQAEEADALEKQRSEEYEKFVDMCKNGQYQEAKDFFNDSSLWYNEDGYRRHYKDSLAYSYYCNGMIKYNNGEYDSALRDFENCDPKVLDTEDMIKKIKNK